MTEPVTREGLSRPSITPEQVHEALRSLYDPAKLLTTRLAAALAPALPAQAAPRERGEALRRLLLDAIEKLRPSGRVAPKASEYRAYQCITMRYISAMPVADIAAELCLSQRQVFRDLRWGLQRLAQLLQELAVSVPAEPASPNPLESELAGLQARPEAVDVAHLLHDALGTVAPLAEARGVAISLFCPSKGTLVRAAPAILREAFVQLLSALVQSLPAVRIGVAAASEAVLIEIPLPAQGPLGREELLEAALQVARSQGFECHRERDSQQVLLQLRAPYAGNRRVLVVEDNPAAFALYERFLANSGWEPILAQHPRAATAMAVTQRVHAIILDIMMPEQDGWRVLQALKLDPQAKDIPVLICSVVNDPELGFALGASAYLTKPLSRPALLAALEEAVRQRKGA